MNTPDIKPGGLISRDAVVELLGGWVLQNAITPYGEGYKDALLDAIRTISNADVLPSVDAEPMQHGRWILDSDDEHASHYHCDKCNAEIDLCNEIYAEPTPNYCPNCGAKMDGGGET